MKHPVRIFFLLFIAAALMISCSKETSFSIIPVIAFQQYVPYGNDSANCYITFKDGDGDDGVLAGDTIPDLIMTYLYDSSGVFVPRNKLGSANIKLPIPPSDTLTYTYLVPNLTPYASANKSLQGQIEIKLRVAPLYYPGDAVVKFAIRFTDRAGHLSNTVYTNSITVTK